MSDFDVIVIGGGSAGSSAARAASLTGKRTAMINEGELGGLCILRGCMPTKSLLEAAHAVHHARHLEPFCARLEGEVTLDFPALMRRKEGHVKRFQRAKIASVEKADYEVIEGRGSFAGPTSVSVGGRALTAEAFVVATGSHPVIPPIPGVSEVPVLTSDDVLELSSVPGRVIVVGGGAIGLECSQFLARMGTEVLLALRSPLMHGTDGEAGEELARALAEEPGLELAQPARILELRKAGEGLEAEIEVGGTRRTHRADAILFAAGRRAALDDIALERVALAPERGRLPHDEHMRTANERVWVAGDATGSYQILHLANQEGAVAGHQAAGGTPARSMDYRLKLSVIFTDPPFAHVGITRPELETLRSEGRAILEAAAHLPQTGRAIVMETRHGTWRLFVDVETCEVLGSTIVGPRADDIIHVMSTLMHFRGTVHDIAAMPWYHPTLTEVIINLERDAASQLAPCERMTPPPA